MSAATHDERAPIVISGDEIDMDLVDEKYFQPSRTKAVMTNQQQAEIIMPAPVRANHDWTGLTHDSNMIGDA